MLVLLPNSCTLHIRDNSKAFEDTANHWAKEAIAFVTARELFAGVSASLFKPDMPMERGMMVTVLYHLAGNPQGLADATFADVKSSDYFAQPVAWAEQHHIAQGTGEHLFEPYGHLTREELAVFTYQYVQYLGWETPVEGNAIREFNDADQISPWAREAMSFAIHADILRGKEGQKLAPQDLATRGEVAVVLEQLVRFLIENVG